MIDAVQATDPLTLAAVAALETLAAQGMPIWVSILAIVVSIAGAVVTTIMAIATWRMAASTRLMAQAALPKPHVVAYAQLNTAQETIALFLKNLGTVPATRITVELPDNFPRVSDATAEGEEFIPIEAVQKAIGLIAPGQACGFPWGKVDELVELAEDLTEEDYTLTVRYCDETGRYQGYGRYPINILEFIVS